MGSVVHMDEFRARHWLAVPDDRDTAIDDSTRARYRACLRTAVEEELKLHVSITSNNGWYLSKDAKARLGGALDNKPVLEATMMQLRCFVRECGLEVAQQIAEQTIHKGFLRIALISGELGVIAFWRYCPR